MRELRKSITRTLATLALASFGLLLSAQTARAEIYADFQVLPSALGGATNTPVLLDSTSGDYAERLTFGANDKFYSDAYWVLSGTTRNEDTTVVNAGTTGIGVDYSIYAIF